MTNAAFQSTASKADLILHILPYIIEYRTATKALLVDRFCAFATPRPKRFQVYFLGEIISSQSQITPLPLLTSLSFCGIWPFRRVNLRQMFEYICDTPSKLFVLDARLLASNVQHHATAYENI